MEQFYSTCCPSTPKAPGLDPAVTPWVKRNSRPRLSSWMAGRFGGTAGCRIRSNSCRPVRVSDGLQVRLAVPSDTKRPDPRGGSEVQADYDSLAVLFLCSFCPASYRPSRLCIYASMPQFIRVHDTLFVCSTSVLRKETT
ncbi:hypothetical protein GN956_G18960 [Arapaima gigas]